MYLWIFFLMLWLYFPVGGASCLTLLLAYGSWKGKATVRALQHLFTDLGKNFVSFPFFFNSAMCRTTGLYLPGVERSFVTAGSVVLKVRKVVLFICSWNRLVAQSEKQSWIIYNWLMRVSKVKMMAEWKYLYSLVQFSICPNKVIFSHFYKVGNLVKLAWTLTQIFNAFPQYSIYTFLNALWVRSCIARFGG